jgi:hypothetical protein
MIGILRREIRRWPGNRLFLHGKLVQGRIGRNGVGRDTSLIDVGRLWRTKGPQEK